MKKQKIANSAAEFIDEDREWPSLTPAQRLLETTKLWEFYIALGGSLNRAVKRPNRRRSG
jgi:hypothetical protein